MVVVLWKVYRSSNFVLSNQGLGVAEVPFWFPGVLGCGISLPSDQECVMTRFSSVSEDHFDFVLFFTIN